MADVYGGPVTRARSRKSRSEEPNNVIPVSKSVSGLNNLELVAEVECIIKTPPRTRSRKTGQTGASMSINSKCLNRLAEVPTQNLEYKEENNILPVRPPL